MKLVELEPRWVGLPHWSSKSVFFIGISFLCPCCRKQRLVVEFKNPIDPDRHSDAPQLQWLKERHAWNREGDSFYNLTLAPSVDFSSSGHWHGDISDGKVTFSGVK